MTNKKWYYLIELSTKRAIELTQLQSSWANISGLSSATDEYLADLTSAGHDRGFLSGPAALALGVSQAELDRVKPLGEAAAKERIRETRNKLLDMSDKAVQIDKWENYSAEVKQSISSYRQALRDITDNTDLFNPEWPVIPTTLSFLNSIEV